MKAWIAIGVIVVLALIFGGSLIGARNELVTEREGIRGAFAQVDSALQRRNDLIPNLVETVKGFAKQEQSVIDSVTKARATMMGAQASGNVEQVNKAEVEMRSALARLLVVVENYPQLKSNENFLHLQDELSGTENRIAVERRKYNDTVQKYNVQVQQFPKNIAASLFGFQREDLYFQADPGAKQAPKVAF